MPTIPGFWEGGPHTPIPVEETWREFVSSVGGDVVETLVPEPRTFENADFLFPHEAVVAELKEVETEFGQSSAFRQGFEGLMGRLMKEDQSWRPRLLGGSGTYPSWFSQEFIRLFRPPVSRILKKANRQIRQTKAHFQIDKPTGILIFVNDGFTELEPHFVRALACGLLVDSYSSVDCFLYVTVNRYVEVADSDVPRLLWMPSYSERASAFLVEFVDELGRRWYDFLEAKIGPFAVPKKEIPQGGDTARPLLSRAIRLPHEKR